MQSSSSLAQNQVYSDNFFIKENTRLIENEIKLLKQIVYLSEKLFNLETYNKVNVSNKTNDCSMMNDSPVSTDTIMNDSQAQDETSSALEQKINDSNIKSKSEIIKKTFQLPPVNTRILTVLKNSKYNENRKKLMKNYNKIIDYTEAILLNEFKYNTSFNNIRKRKTHGYVMYRKCKICNSLWTIHFNNRKNEATFSCRNPCKHTI